MCEDNSGSWHGAAFSVNNAPESVQESVCSDGNTSVKNYNIEVRVY